MIKKLGRDDLQTFWQDSLGRLPEKKREQGFLSIDIARVQQAWPLIAGEQLAVHSLPYVVRKGRLSIRVDHPVFSQQLQFMAPELLKKLNSQLGLKLAGFDFSTGQIYWPNRQQEPEKKSAPKPEAPLSAEDKERQDIIDQLIKSIESI